MEGEGASCSLCNVCLIRITKQPPAASGLMSNCLVVEVGVFPVWVGYIKEGSGLPTPIGCINFWLIAFSDCAEALAGESSSLQT